MRIPIFRLEQSIFPRGFIKDLATLDLQTEAPRKNALFSTEKHSHPFSLWTVKNNYSSIFTKISHNFYLGKARMDCVIENSPEFAH